MYDMIHSINWELLEGFQNAEDACIYFYNKLYNIFDVCVPKYTIKSNKRYPPWFDYNIIRQIRQKAKFWRKYKKDTDEDAYRQFALLRAKIKADVEAAYKNFIKSAENDIKTDPNKFWAFISRKKGMASLPNNMSYDGDILNDPAKIANGFADYFSKSYIISSAITVTDTYVHTASLNINDFEESSVLKAMKEIKPKKTTGPDGIPAYILRDCAYVLSYPLTVLFNICIRTSTIPSVWKSSKVCPIYKKGDRHDLTNYRSISIICNFCKVLEILL